MPENIFQEETEMKKTLALLLAIATMLALLFAYPLATSADETPQVWDGTANIKWYFDGKSKSEYHIGTAQDFAGLAYMVGAGNKTAVYNGVYYDAEYNVLGFRTSGKEAEYVDSTLVYTPTEGDGSSVTDGSSFQWEMFYLESDIVLNTGNAVDWETTPPANVWLPIGGARHINATSSGFNGIFDGQGHTVSGAYYVGGEESFAVSLFGYAGKAGNTQFKNLTVENCYFKGQYSIGGIVGRSNKPIEMVNCYVKNCVMVSTEQQSAGLIAAVFNGAATISKCGVENVTLKGRDYVGGFVGTLVGVGLTITDSYVTGTATATPAIEIVPGTDGQPDTEKRYGGDEVGLIVGRAAGGNINISNVFVNLKVEQLGLQDDIPDSSDRVATAGVIYAGHGTANAPALNVENFFYVDDFTAEHVIGKDIETATAITVEQLTGEAAKTVLPTFDFDNIWQVNAAGLPTLRAEAIMEALNNADDPGDDPIDIVDPGENTTTKKPETTTAAPVTDEPTTEPTGKTKKGCGSVLVGMPVIGVIALAGTVLAVKKKKEEI